MTAKDFSKIFIRVPLQKYPPIITEKTHGKKWTQMSKDELDTYHKKSFSPKLNQGIPCGEVNNLTIIDFDFYKEGKDETKRMYEEYFKDKCNYIVQSASGGIHCYFQYHPELYSTQSDKMAIDILSDGKYAVAPGSKTANGVYKIIKGDDDTKLTSIDPIQYKVLLKSVYSKEDEKRDEKQEILNGMFNMDASWSISEEQDGTYQCITDRYTCLVKPEYTHSQLNHSCLYIGKYHAVAKCHRHGKKNLLKKDYPSLVNLKQSLGLVKAKKTKDDLNDHQILIEYLKEDCMANNFKKEGNWIIKPLKDIPTYYERHLTFDDYLNQLYTDKDHHTYYAYRKSAKTHKNLVEYLTCYNDKEIPRITRNHKWFSFNNGVLDVEEMKFMTFDDLIDTTETSGVYIQKDFNPELLDKNYDEIEVPYFDKLVKHHINEDMVYYLLLAFIGRLFFKVGEKDNWQCMPFIRGKANTGKSTFFLIIMAIFNPACIGKNGKETTFGLQNLFDKLVVINEDIDHNISKYLPASDFQSMVSGENMAIGRKGKDQITTLWEVPMLWGGNVLPDYKDKGGSISRRLAIFDMNRSVENKDTTLSHHIKQDELDLIVIKAVKSYYHFIKFFGNTTFVDWGKKFGIEYFDERIEQVRQETNLLYQFLTASPGTNETRNSDIYIVHNKGSITSLEKFKKYYKTYLHYKHDMKSFTWSRTADHAIIEGEGYTISQIQICASCGDKARAPKKNEEGCCHNFSRQNRRKKWVIQDMEIRDDKDGYY